jgi:FkbM family methyltransferase
MSAPAREVVTAEGQVVAGDEAASESPPSINLDERLRASGRIEWPDYDGRCALSAVGPLLAWWRRKTTAHLRAEYLDPILRQVEAHNQLQTETLIEALRQSQETRQQLTGQVRSLRRQIAMLSAARVTPDGNAAAADPPSSLPESASRTTSPRTLSLRPRQRNSTAATDGDIYHCYRFFLDREPDKAGWTFWTHAVRRHRMTMRDIVKSFQSSSEYLASSHYLTSDAFRNQLSGDTAPRFRRVSLDGFKIYVDVEDTAVGAGILSTKTYEPILSNRLRTLLRPGFTFLDLGANIGYYTLLAASLVGVEGRVLAFEPNLDNCALLTLSIKDNGFTNIQLHPLAVAEREQNFKLYPHKTKSLSHVVDLSQPITNITEEPRLIRAVALDDFLADLPRLDVIKSDIDGNDPRALEGMQKLLARHRPVIITEFEPTLIASVTRRTPVSFLRQFADADYDLFLLQQDAEAPGRSGLSAEAILETYEESGKDHLDLIAYPRLAA